MSDQPLTIADRRAAIIARFAACGYDPGFMQALHAYLDDTGTLADLRSQSLLHTESLPDPPFAGLHGPPDTLDDLDAQLLDVCSVAGQRIVLYDSLLEHAGPERIFNYLRTCGDDETRLLWEFMFSLRRHADEGRRTPKLESWLIGAIPAKWDTLVAVTKDDYGLARRLLQLTLAHGPAEHERAWSFAQQRAHLEGVGVDDAAILLQAAPDVFFPRVQAMLQTTVEQHEFNWDKAWTSLLHHPWPAQHLWMGEVLARGVPKKGADISHRHKLIQAAAQAWLADQGAASLPVLESLLGNERPETRLAAVQTLETIASPAAVALLRTRQRHEENALVRQALLDAVGFAWATPDILKDADAFRQQLADDVDDTPNEVIPTWLDVAATSLRWTTGAAVAPAVLRWLLQAQARTNRADVGRAAQQLIAHLDRATTVPWAAALWQQWISNGATSKEAWLLPLIGALGDDSLVAPVSAQITAWAKGVRGAVAARAVAVLGMLGTRSALAAVDGLRTIKHKQVQAAAEAALAAAGKRLGLSPDDLADRNVPDLGFNADGTRPFSYGARQFTARLRSNGALVFIDSDGKRLPKLPAPTAEDDATEAKAAQAAAKTLAKILSTEAKRQSSRLERALVEQRRWTVAQWREVFTTQPLLRALATGLVWGELPPDTSRPTRLFHLHEDGTLHGLTGAEAWPTAGHIRGAHPTEMAAADVAAWQAYLPTHDLEPPFAQLQRPHVPRPSDGTAQRWEQFEGYLLNGGTLKGLYQAAGWERGSVQDNGIYHLIWRTFPNAGVEAVIETTGLGVGNEHEMDVALLSLSFVAYPTDHARFWRSAGDETLPLSVIPAIAWNEAAGALQSFAAAATYDVAWRKKT